MHIKGAVERPDKKIAVGIANATTAFGGSTMFDSLASQGQEDRSK